MADTTMLIKALILALACACVASVAPLSAGGDDSDCALYLTGPGRSSAYDYSINLLKGNFGYEGQHTCITYEAVNQAYLEARQRILVSQPKGDWKPEDYASVGELVLDISINIARRYGLTYEEIEKGLPLIDTSRTLIREVCPPVFSHVECRAGKYRRLDGLCNNLQHPTWGAINSPFQRLLSPLFSDGINSPRIAHSGRDLPLSRVVSRTMHPDDGFHDHAGTVMVIAWGQFMDHDYTLTGTPLDPINRNDPEECCKRPPHLKHPYCNEIRIPDDDYFYRLFGVKCIDFVRGFPSPRPGCRLGSRTPFNTLTGAIDGNTVYGVTEKFARKLRTGFGGLLRMNPVFKEYGLKDLLPLKLDIPDEGCTRPNKNMYCFEAGEIRVNEQLVLTVMHTLMAREHNRVANGLAEVNPHWDDESLYQEARRINIAEIQHITYNEFLPILLGKDVMEKFGLVLEKEGYWDGYDHDVNPDVLAAFAAAAYRFGHSLLPTAVERWSKAHKFIASKRLSDLIRRPYDLYRAGVLDEYVMGLMNQVAQAMDDSITQEVTNHLFKKVGARFGMDLVSFNMQRGREFGLPGYMEFRKFCGLPGAETFQDLFGSMSNQTVRKYETIFEHPVDVDLWSGGVSERPLPGSMLGPTFACIIATQFSYSRRGDRFWFELPHQPSSFTPEQLAEIRKSRLARVICDNTDIIDTVQLYPMVLPDHELNPRVPCRSGILPSMDFSKWAEPAPFRGTAKGFMTDAYINKNVSNTNETAPANHTRGDIESKNISEENCSSDTLATNLNCNCNETDSSDKEAPLKSNALVDESNESSHLNIAINITQNIKSNPNRAADPNTVLKYVYKTNERTNIPDKTTGHLKNSLKRKKRSPNVENLNDTKTPLILNYETAHAPQRDKEIWLPARNTANVINKANLADFNIETLHEDTNIDEPVNKNLNQPPPETVLENTNDSNESTDRENYRNNNEKSNNDPEESGERESSENNQKSSEEDHYSPRNNEKYSGPQQNEKHNHLSNEEQNSSNEAQNSSNEAQSSSNEADEADNKGSKEDSISKEYDNSKYTKPHNIVDESIENSSEETGKNDIRHSSENKGHTSEENSNSKYKAEDQYEPTYGKSYDSPAIIQDVDLGEYERIQVNKNGEIETAKDSYENRSFDPAVEIISTPKPNFRIIVKENDKISSLPKESRDSSSVEFEHIEPTHINDGEVKPVVEINPEAESTESSDENSNEALKVKLESESLETLTGVNESDSSEKSDNLKAEKESQSKGDVKQEFERIPLNYNHVDTKGKKDSDVKNEETNEETNNNSDDEGTLDNLKPRYDENLNIKFDDIQIKLPEIKLPEDILSYDFESPPVYKDNDEQQKGSRFYQDPSSYRKEKEEQVEKPTYYHDSPVYQNNNENANKLKFYHYGDELQEKPHADRNSEEDNDDEDDDENDDDDADDSNGYKNNYSGYYGGKKSKEDYKQKNDDEADEDSDLYEKFVRERFGKRGTFEKRSEKLTDYKTQNPHLYKKVQKILKKTKEVKNQADKSGDPNAAYMWTLEYGEKL